MRFLDYNSEKNIWCHDTFNNVNDNSDNIYFSASFFNNNKGVEDDKNNVDKDVDHKLYIYFF